MGRLRDYAHVVAAVAHREPAPLGEQALARAHRRRVQRREHHDPQALSPRTARRRRQCSSTSRLHSRRPWSRAPERCSARRAREHIAREPLGRQGLDRVGDRSSQRPGDPALERRVGPYACGRRECPPAHASATPRATRARRVRLAPSGARAAAQNARRNGGRAAADAPRARRPSRRGRPWRGSGRQGRVEVGVLRAVQRIVDGRLVVPAAEFRGRIVCTRRSPNSGASNARASRRPICVTEWKYASDGVRAMLVRNVSPRSQRGAESSLGYIDPSQPRARGPYVRACGAHDSPAGCCARNAGSQRTSRHRRHPRARR